MAKYTKQEWIDQTETQTGTPVDAEHMNHIEDGIAAASITYDEETETLIIGG